MPSHDILIYLNGRLERGIKAELRCAVIKVYLWWHFILGNICFTKFRLEGIGRHIEWHTQNGKKITSSFINKIIHKITGGFCIEWHHANEQNSKILIFLNKHVLNTYYGLGIRLGLRNNKVNRTWSFTSRRLIFQGRNHSFYIQTYCNMTWKALW